MGEGRKTKTRMVVQRVDPVDEDDEERGIDVKKPLTLRAESEVTRQTGFYRTQLGSNVAPKQLIWGDRAYRFVARARDAEIALVTASRFDTFPELQTTDLSFSKTTPISNVGEQMAQFKWGTSELMSFKNAKGVPLQAGLYKPADFDPKKKYPLMVYIYERLSQNVHNFVNPAPSNGVNTSLYVSNGYVILQPDIAYTIGYPGKSALDAVLPAIDTLVKQGYIDEKAIGIQGHSWGGYQIAWMVTKTNRFRAAEAGAPVGNMTSAYSGIRWGSGLPRQFQYEKTQSRIGKPLQAATNLYIENSPIFHIKSVKTPLLILANDADDAVPWYQGIEFFLALRRYEKEAYLFNYNGQLHNLRRRADQKDFALRMHQYFDHFLKGAPAPDWMTKGIPFNEREDEKETFGKALAGDVKK
jgi:dipeptidyl aminopeptidase/acylaminoacyl peptidase